MFQLPAMPKMVQKPPVAPKALLSDNKPHAAKQNTPPHNQKNRVHQNETHGAHKAHVHAPKNMNDGKNSMIEEVDFSDILAGAAINQENEAKTDVPKTDALKADAEATAIEPVDESEVAVIVAMLPIVEPKITQNVNKLAELDINHPAELSTPSQVKNPIQSEQQTTVAKAQIKTKNAVSSGEINPDDPDNLVKINADLAAVVTKLSDVATTDEAAGVKNPLAADLNPSPEAVKLADVNLTDTDGQNGLKQVIGRILEGLANLSGEGIEKSVATPEISAKLTTQFNKIVEHYRQNGASDEVKAAFAKFSQVLTETTKILNVIANPPSIEVAKAAQQTLDIQIAKASEVPQNLAQKPEEQTAKPQPAQPTNTEPQNNIALNKYAGRYSNNSYSNVAETQANAQTVAEISAKNRSSSAYTATASTADLNKSSSTSALEKMNQNSPMDFLNQMQANLGNQQFDAHNQDNVVNIKLAIQNGRLGQNLPVNGMAFQIGKQINKGNSEFQIRLDPAELGRINVKLTVKQGGDVKAHLVAERNDVFELLQRDARALERALADAGLDGQNIELEFSLAQGGLDGQDFADNMADENNNDGDNKSLESELDEDMVNMVANHIPLHVTSNGIDRKI